MSTSFGWKRCCLFFALAVAVLALACCGERAGTGGASVSGDDPAKAGWPDVVRLGLIPSEGGADIVDRFAPLGAHLEARLGRPVRVSSASEYVGVITAMRNKQIDIAYFGPKSYVEAHRMAGAVAVAKELNELGEEGYYAIIITRQDTGLRTLADLAGKTVGFVTPNSTSGYLLPSLGVIEATGMKPEDFFGQVRYTGTHGNAIQAVLAGDLVAAAANTLDLAAMVRSGLDASPLVEVWRSELIPSSPIAVRGDLPVSFQDAVRDALVDFTIESQSLDKMARGGFLPADDAEYDIIRVLEQQHRELIGGP